MGPLANLLSEFAYLYQLSVYNLNLHSISLSVLEMFVSIIKLAQIMLLNLNVVP